MPTVECDACGTPFEAVPDASGKAACPKCGDVLRVAMGQVAVSSDAGTSTPKQHSIAAEKELLVVRPALFRGHPFAYGGLVLLGVAGLVVTILPLLGGVTAPFAIAGAVMVLIAVIGFMKLFVLSHRWYRLRITDRRTIDERGIITRRHSEVLHDHAVNIRIQQSVWQRLMNLGDFQIESAAGGSVDPESGTRSSTEIAIRDIPDPYGVKALIDQHRGR
ncbi:MAG: PH domain-containing protein [Phycisphaerae bacterium]|nr:PH domain-containing protein [Phycisphaerae bacterium]